MRIHTHHDADGLSSAYLLSLALDIDLDNIVFPNQFGDTTAWQSGDYMTDMRPINPEIEGIVIDHHLGHPKERKYTLIWEDKPTALIVYEHFREQIPQKEHWKVVIGLAGDMRLDLMPIEIIDNNKELLLIRKTWAEQVYGKTKVNYLPVYKLLAKPINAYARHKKERDALRLIADAKSPLDIIEDADGIELSKNVSTEYKRILQSSTIYEFSNVILIVFESDLRMTGYVSTVLSNDLNKTVIAVNSKDNSVSVRGDLTRFLQSKISSDILEIDGHEMAMGGICKDIKSLVRELSFLHI